MICYHHNDCDGKSAAYAVHMHKPRMIEDKPEDYWQCTYDSVFDKHTKKDDVVIVDLSFTINNYKTLVNICNTAKSVTWIDHHTSSVEVIEKYEDELQAITNLTYFVSSAASGAALAYVYFTNINLVRDMYRKKAPNEHYEITASMKYSDTDSIIIFSLNHKDKKSLPTVPESVSVKLPEYFRYVSDFDTWTKHYEESDLFLLGFDCNNTAFTIYDEKRERRIFNHFYDNIEDRVNDFINDGKIIDKYIHCKYRRELRNTFVWNYNGTEFICTNNTGNSWCFEDKIKKYKACILFFYNGSTGKWQYSVYSDEASDFNCAEFAMSFGGGGHMHAAGFSTEKLIFTSPQYKEEAEISKNIYVESPNENWITEFISKWKKNKKTTGIPVKDSFSVYGEDKKYKTNSAIIVYEIPYDNLVDPGIISNIISNSYNTHSLKNKIIMVINSRDTIQHYDNVGSEVNEKFSYITTIIEENGGKAFILNGINNDMDSLVEFIVNEYTSCKN